MFIAAACILFLIKLRWLQNKTPLTQSTKAINNVNVIQNIYSKNLNNERPTNGTSWYSFVTNTGFEAF